MVILLFAMSIVVPPVAVVRQRYDKNAVAVHGPFPARKKREAKGRERKGISALAGGGADCPESLGVLFPPSGGSGKRGCSVRVTGRSG